MRSVIQKLRQDKIVRASAGIFMVMALVKMAGYFEKVIMSYYWGTGYVADVYETVFTIITAVFLFTREVIEPGFLYYFMRTKTTDERKAWSMFNFFFRLILILGLALVIPALLFPGQLMTLLAPGFTAEKKELAVQFTRVSFTGVVFYCLSSLTGITLNAYKKFTLPALGDLAFKLCLVAAIVLSGIQWGPMALAWGLLLACIARLLVHLITLRKYVRDYRALSPRTGKSSEVWRLTWPLLLGVAFSQFTTLGYNLLASRLEDGSIAALGYARKTAELPVILFPFVLSVVVFPFFTEMHATGNKEKATRLLANTCRWLLIVFVPLSIIFSLFSTEIISLIYKRGAFDERSVVLTSIPFKIFSMGLVFMALETVLVIFFYSMGNTLTPVIVGMICAAISIVIAYALIGRLGNAAIALGFITGRLLKNCTLLVILNEKKYLRLNYGLLKLHQ